MRCKCGVMLKPGQHRCKDCSAVILAMIKTDRITPPVTVPADKTQRMPWGLSFQERQYRREYIKRIVAAALIVMIVGALAVWALFSK